MSLEVLYSLLTGITFVFAAFMYSPTCEANFFYPAGYFLHPGLNYVS